MVLRIKAIIIASETNHILIIARLQIISAPVSPASLETVPQTEGLNVILLLLALTRPWHSPDVAPTTVMRPSANRPFARPLAITRRCLSRWPSGLRWTKCGLMCPAVWSSGCR